MIHVGFPLYDSTGRYSKYEAVALLSLLTNTSERLTIHIVHDNTVSEKIKAKLKAICDRFEQNIVFHIVKQSDFHSLEALVRSYTIGTLFRLKLPEIIDDSISKILFLDADLLINTDIKPIWDMDISEYYVAACKDDGIDDDNMLLADGLVPATKYYNAGVVVFNLEKIRKDFDLFEDSAKFLIEHPNCPLVDQDAANYFFMDNVLYLDAKYNMFTRNKRGKNLQLEDGIYHYAGDYVCLDDPEEFDKKYIEYMSLLHWDNNTGLDGFMWGYVGNAHRQIDTLQCLCNWISNRDNDIVIWGAGSKYLSKIYEIVHLSAVSFFVDNNKKIQGKIFNGRIVKSPDCIQGKKNVKVIVISKDYYGEIKGQLESYDFVENIDFVDGLLLLLQSQGGRVKAY